MIKIIFFDFDGVLVESLDIKTQAFGKLFQKEGQDAVKKVLEHHNNNCGVSRFEKFKYIYKEILKRPLSDSEFKSLCDRFSELVVESVVNAPYVKGADEFLKSFSHKYDSFVVSATPEGEIREIVKRRSMEKFFKGIYGSPRKKIDLVSEILSERGVNPRNAVYIGDAATDRDAAQKNDVNFIARIKNNEEIFKNGNYPKINDLTDLSKIIEGL